MSGSEERPERAQVSPTPKLVTKNELQISIALASLSVSNATLISALREILPTIADEKIKSNVYGLLNTAIIESINASNAIGNIGVINE